MVLHDELRGAARLLVLLADCDDVLASPPAPRWPGAPLREAEPRVAWCDCGDDATQAFRVPHHAAAWVVRVLRGEAAAALRALGVEPPPASPADPPPPTRPHVPPEEDSR